MFQQEKLSKDIDYLIGKESQVKRQISELNLLMKETEVNEKLVCIFISITFLIYKILGVVYELGIQN